MSPEMVMAVAKDTLLTAMLLAAPPLGIGILVGLTISILQAVTQIQEQTLTFVPKIFAIFLALLVFGPWMLNVILDFAVNILSNLSNVIN